MKGKCSGYRGRQLLRPTRGATQPNAIKIKTLKYCRINISNSPSWLHLLILPLNRHTRPEQMHQNQAWENRTYRNGRSVNYKSCYFAYTSFTIPTVTQLIMTAAATQMQSMIIQDINPVSYCGLTSHTIKHTFTQLRRRQDIISCTIAWVAHSRCRTTSNVMQGWTSHSMDCHRTSFIS
jgi:hypothetical protein